MKVNLVFKSLLMLIITLASLSAASAFNAKVVSGSDIPLLPDAVQVSFIDHYAEQPGREHVNSYEREIKLVFSGVADAKLLPITLAAKDIQPILTITEYYPVFDRDSRREAKNGFRKEHVYTHIRNDGVSYNLYIQPLNGEKITARLSESADALPGEIYAGAIEDRVLNENNFVKHLFFKVEGQASTPPANNPPPQPTPLPVPIPVTVFGIFVENQDENGVYSSDFLVAPNGGSISELMLGEISLAAADMFYTQPSREHVVQYTKLNRFYVNGVQDAVILKGSEPAPDGYEKVAAFNDSYPVFDRDSRRRVQNGFRKEHVYSHVRNDAVSYTLYIKPLNGEKFESMLLDNRDSGQFLINDGWLYAGRITDRILNENSWDKHLFVKVITQNSGTTPGGSGSGSDSGTGSGDSGSSGGSGLDNGSGTGSTSGSGSDSSLTGSNSENVSSAAGGGDSGNSGNTQSTNYSNNSNGGHGSYHRNAKKHSITIQSLDVDKYTANCGDELTFTAVLRNSGRTKEDNVEIEVANLEFGIYEKSIPITLLASRSTVEDMTIKLPKTYTNGVYNFVVKASYNGIVTNTRTETIEVNACSLAAQKQPIVPTAAVKEDKDSEIEVKFPPALEEQPEGNSWFWLILGVLSTLILIEIAGFTAWGYQKQKKTVENAAKDEIEKQLNSFSEKDRFY